MQAEPRRDSKSQALVFPPDNGEVQLLQLRVRKLETALVQLLDFITDLPKPAGKNLTIESIRKTLNS